MEEISESDREVQPARAMRQFLELYRHVSSKAIFFFLPSNPGLQDQPYVANVAAVLPHCSQDTVLISRFRASGRSGESLIGSEFFRLMNFSVHQTPETIGGCEAYFEGEADLEHVHGNVYVGAYGIRTSLNTLEWATERFEMNIIPFRMTDPYQYHLDCCVLRLSEEAMLVCTSVADRSFLSQLEKHCEILDVTLEEARSGMTNSLVLDNEILCDTDIQCHSRDDPLYAAGRTRQARGKLERICERFGREFAIVLFVRILQESERAAFVP